MRLRLCCGSVKGMSENLKIFPIRVSERLLEKLDEIRKRQADLPGRAEMFRRLVERECDNPRHWPDKASREVRS